MQEIKSRVINLKNKKFNQNPQKLALQQDNLKKVHQDLLIINPLKYRHTKISANQDWNPKRKDLY